jgi:hypothetical protein
VQSLQFIGFSGHNPPPDRQRLRGDFFYLQVRTLEGIDFHVTACEQGFFVNNSNTSHFDPSPNPGHKGTHFNLLDLLRILSPKFKAAFTEMCNIKLS